MTPDDARRVAAGQQSLFRFIFHRDVYAMEGWRLYFVWRPRPDLTGEGYLVACSWHVVLRFRSPIKIVSSGSIASTRPLLNEAPHDR